MCVSVSVPVEAFIDRLSRVLFEDCVERVGVFIGQLHVRSGGWITSTVIRLSGRFSDVCVRACMRVRACVRACVRVCVCVCCVVLCFQSVCLGGRVVNLSGSTPYYHPLSCKASCLFQSTKGHSVLSQRSYAMPSRTPLSTGVSRASSVAYGQYSLPAQHPC